MISAAPLGPACRRNRASSFVDPSRICASRAESFLRGGSDRRGAMLGSLGSKPISMVSRLAVKCVLFAALLGPSCRRKRASSFVDPSRIWASRGANLLRGIDWRGAVLGSCGSKPISMVSTPTVGCVLTAEYDFLRVARTSGSRVDLASLLEAIDD